MQFTTDDIDQQSEILLREFRERVTELQADHPQMTDQRKLFDLWAVQKIAGLQCFVYELVDRLEALEGSASQTPSANCDPITRPR